MKYVGTIVILTVCMFNSVAVSSNSDMLPHYITKAADEFELDTALLYAICSVESHCRASAINKNDATQSRRLAGIKEHSHGMFQIKMATARALGFKGAKKDLMRADINTWYAAKLLRQLYDKYDTTPEVISAYNAGRPIKGNVKYVNKVLKYYVTYKIDKKL